MKTTKLFFTLLGSTMPCNFTLENNTKITMNGLGINYSQLSQNRHK